MLLNVLKSHPVSHHTDVDMELENVPRAWPLRSPTPLQFLILPLDMLHLRMLMLLVAEWRCLGSATGDEVLLFL
jgi:hypothetical protein